MLLKKSDVAEKEGEKNEGAQGKDQSSNKAKELIGEAPYPKHFKTVQVAPDASRLGDHIDIVDSPLLRELKKNNIKIHLLQAIKDIPELNELIKSLFIKPHGRKMKFPSTIQVGTKLIDILSGRLLP